MYRNIKSISSIDLELDTLGELVKLNNHSTQLNKNTIEDQSLEIEMIEHKIFLA